MRRLTFVIVACALAAAGCHDLDVTNPNNPDRERVINRPGDVESLISSSFKGWFQNSQNGYPNLALAAMADNITGGFFDYSVHDVSTIPRNAWNNSQLNTRSAVNRQPWYDMYGVISNVNDGLAALDGGMILDAGETPGPNTRRARAFGKLMQGLGHGYLALLVDQALIVTEDTDLETLDTRAFFPYTEVRDAAISQLDEAITLAQSGTFAIPGGIEWIHGIPLTNQDLARLANSFAARFMVYTARTPQERAAVDWNEVLRRVDAGIDFDLAPQGQLDVVDSNFRRLLARVRTRKSDHIRPSSMMLGPADVSGKFQAWMAAPAQDRQPFQIETPDRRIQGAGGPSTPGKYVGYDRQTIWPADRGTYRYSYYWYFRDGAGETWYTDPQPTMTVDEMMLLKAEALIRLGRAAEAVPLINRTRVANGELPPVTTSGPPEAPDCVPRKVNGACGSLWDALTYEKNLEMHAVEGGVAFYDARGWGILQEGTPIHMPVPGRELDNLGVGLYTFGGVGGTGGAAPPQYNACPAGVALPRC